MTHEPPVPRPLGAAFWRIWSAQTVSTLGSAVAGFGIAVHVFLESGNALWLGVLMAAAGLPFVVLTPLLGRIDRFDRRTVMIVGDSVAAVGTLAALAFALGGRLEVWHLVVAAVIGGIGTAIQMPAAQAAVAVLVEHDRLDRANGLSQIGPAGGIVAAPVIATMLVSRWGITAVLIVDAVTFAVAVIATALTPFRSRPDHHAEQHPDDDDSDRCDSPAAVRGWAPVFDWMRGPGHGVAALLALSATVNLCLGFFNVALVAVVATIDEQWAGLPLAAGGVAMLGAGIVIGRRGLPDRRVPAIAMGLFMLAAGCAICGLRPSLTVVALGAAVALAAVPILSTASTTMLHERVPAGMHGRMFALRGGISRALDPIGAVVAGVTISAFAEPAMSPDGALHRTAGRVLATGDGRGAALVMVLVASAIGIIAMVARSSGSLRRLDGPRPEGNTRQVEAAQIEGAEVEPVGSRPVEAVG
jgi:MFS transporter, DHA3 family, macrolide efflux protein